MAPDWTQQAPSLAEVIQSKRVWPVGHIEFVINKDEGPTHGKTARACVLGVATREDFIRTGPEAPNPDYPYFYWISLD